jgi:hypothetical protein
MDAASDWADAWPEINAEIAGVPLREAHDLLINRAESLLPFAVETP